MVATHDIKMFSKGEDVRFSVLLKNRDGTPLSDAGTQTINFVISKKNVGSVYADFTSDPQVVLVDPSAANWTIELSRADLSFMKQGTDYEYNVWSTSASTWRMLQITGTFTLLQADSPS